MSITLTDSAADRFKRHIESRGKGIGVRLGVKTTGCSGLAYTIEYADEVRVDDKVFEDKGVTLVIDAKTLAYLSEDTRLDFAKEGLNEGFKFINPNEKARCGCGESFSV